MYLNKIPIYTDNLGMNAVFVKANSALIKKHHSKLVNITSAIDGKAELEQLWLSEYKAKINKDADDCWIFAEFKDANSATIFVLKWG